MRQKDNYDDFQDRMFQQIKDLEDLQKQIAKQEASPLLKVAELYGLGTEDVLKVYRTGMNGQQLADAMKSVRKK